MPTILFSAFITLPLLGAIFLDIEHFLLFLGLFCVVGFVCAASIERTMRSTERDKRRPPMLSGSEKETTVGKQR